jgi:hypothetical protein
MRAFEALGEIDKDGRIKLETPIGVEGQKVKVIILIPDHEEISDTEWLKVINQSDSFDFLNDPEEDIYTLEDGKPITDEI